MPDRNYYIHWLDRTSGKWHAMSAGEYTDLVLELVFLVNPESYIDEQMHRDEAE